MTLKEFLFSKQYNSLYWIFKHEIPNYIPFTKSWNIMRNPYNHWWKCRKVFKRPRWKLCHFGKFIWFYGMPLCEKYYNPILSIKIRPLGWKTKYDEFRHEYDPFIVIMLFRKWMILWKLTYKGDSTRSMATWEAMLDYIYGNRSIEWCKANHVWLSDTEEITINQNLKKCYM